MGATATKAKVEFVKQGRSGQNAVADTMTWRTRCGRWAVVRSRYRQSAPRRIGRRANPEAIQDRYRAVRLTEHGTYLISRHRTRKAAEDAVRADAGKTTRR